MVRSELSVIGKLVLRGTRIIVPSSLRERLLNLAHEGHSGIVLMKHSVRKFGGEIMTRMLKDSVSDALLAKWFQCHHHQNHSREQSSHQVHGNISQRSYGSITTFRKPPVCSSRLLQPIYGSTSSKVYYNWQDYKKTQKCVSHSWYASEYHHR